MGINSEEGYVFGWKPEVIRSVVSLAVQGVSHVDIMAIWELPVAAISSIVTTFTESDVDF